jgi:hypothetical protein
MTTPRFDRNLARVIGLLLLIAIILGSYDLQLELVTKTDTGSLEALQGDYRALANSFRTMAIINVAVATLSLIAGYCFFMLLRQIATGPAAAAFVLRGIEIALGLAAVWFALELAEVFAGEPGAAATLAGQAEPWQDLSWKAFHYGLAASSLGAAINFGLMFRGRYIPRLLAAYGVLASLFVTVSIVAMELSPTAGDYVYPAYVFGNAAAFILLTLWLLIRGVDSAWWKSGQQATDRSAP